MGNDIITSKIEKKRTVAVLLFKDVEILDFAGPLEVFSVAHELSGNLLWDIHLVGFHRMALRTRYGLCVTPDKTIEDIPAPDLVIIPGGRGVREILSNEMILHSLKNWILGSKHILSVCTGSLILGKTGFLDYKSATTHIENLTELQEIAPKAKVVSQRFVDNGALLCAEGISAGIDASLYYIQREAGRKLAERTAAYMMYNGLWMNNQIR